MSGTCAYVAVQETWGSCKLRACAVFETVD